MGTREWTFSTFMGCCVWILHGLGAAAATTPVTTEGLFAVGTASPTMVESEGPHDLVMGTAEANTVAANAETADSILVENPLSPSSPPGPEPDALVTAVSNYGSTVPALMNVTKPLNTSQDIERGSAAPTAATTTAAISAQHPAVTPEAELDVTGPAPDAALGSTPLFADVKEDILAAVTREGADLDPTASAVSLPTTPPLAVSWGAQPTAGSPVGAGVTVLPSQGLTTATGAVEEGITLPVDTQSEASANSSSPSPGTGGLLTTQQDGVVNRAMGITPEPVGENAPAVEESPSALVHGDTADAVNGEFSTVGSSSLPLESPTVSGTVGNPGEPSLLHGQAVLSPATLLPPANGGDGDGQRAPGVLSEAPGSALSPADSEAPMAPKVTGDMAITPLVPTDTQSDMNPPLPDTALPTGDVGAVGLAKPSLQPAPWQTPTGEQPPLLSPTDTPSAPGAAHPPPGTEASTLPAPDGGAEIPASPNLSAAPGAPVSPSLGGSQPWGMAAGAPQGADGPGTGLSSASDAPIPVSFVPDGLAWPTAGVQGQGAEGAGGTALAGGPGDGSPSADTQSDMSPSDFSTQQDPANAGLLPVGATGALANADLSPPSALRDGAGTGAALAMGQVSPPSPAPPSSAGLEPSLSGAEGPGDLPGESTSTPGAVASPMAGAETAASLNPGAAQEAPMSPSFGGSQPWGTATGGPQGAGLPGANGPGTGLTSAWDVSSPATYGPAEPSSPALGVQLGTNLGLPAAEGHTAGTAEPVLGGAGSGTSFEPSLSSTAGSVMTSVMDQLPGAGSLSGPASPSDVVAASSISEGDGAGPMPDAAPGPDSLSLASPDSETGPALTLVQGAESAGNVEQAGIPQSESPYMQSSPSEFNTQQEAANNGELPAGETGPLVNADLSPPSALRDGAGTGAAPALEQVSPPGPAPPSSAGLDPSLSGAEGPGDLPGESTSTPGAVAGPMAGAETAASLNPGAAQEAPMSPSFGGSQPWGTATGGPQGAGLPGANGPSTSLTSAWDQPPHAGSSSGPASPSDVVAAPSISDPASPSALGGAGGAPGALQPSLGAGPGVPPAAGEGAGEGAGDGMAPEQSQATAGEGPVDSGARDGQMGAVLQTASASPSTEGSSSPGTAGKTANGASLQGAGTAGSGLSTGLEPAGPEEPPVSAPSIQNGASLGLSDAKLSQVNVVEVPGGALVNRGASLGASLGEGTGAIIQIASGALDPSALTSPQERQPLDPVAPNTSGISDSMAASLAASLLLPGHGLGLGLAPSGDPRSASGIQSGSRALAPGAQGGLAGDAGGAQMWSLEDEVASGMPAPLGEASTHALASPNTAPVLPSAPQRQNTAAGVSASPGLSTPLSAFAAVPLYGYGAKENDRQYVERRVDFNSPLFKPETGFPFGKTLRNSLYFTDNGQIIFPASDNSIFTSPNPPPSGFNGHEEVPMIAVFWDNADFSRGVGTTFYQEFLTLNTAKPPFVRDVEAKVRRYLRSSYSAAWTLKITWEKAPAYAARTDTRRTITYQAVLTTDGFRSYVLMLYQEGGMQWDYTRLTTTNVLIGYTSGDGFYRNDDLTQRPPAAKYRPDQFRGYNTDLRGLWIYKLESRVRVNYRLKCLAWTGQQQEPRVWSQGLPACPCSLQQGQQDPRFKSSRGGWWAARVSMLHSASPNQHGAGVRCLYDSQSQLIEGRQERYWRSSRQASPYRDQELKLYDWCCNQAGSAHLCTRYSEKRPKIGCDGYQPPSMGSSEEQESDSEEQKGQVTGGLNTCSMVWATADPPSPLLLLISCVRLLPPAPITPTHHTGQLTQPVPAVAFTGTSSCFSSRPVPRSQLL
ncbi:mucin-4 isoform X2 [Haliaeetus albicilla]|uniref:mucin-4 isoform X2 n=1 Tax=Haliaeetus albicilla TaxID=8969 RepID=UPI0037E8E2CF